MTPDKDKPEKELNVQQQIFVDYICSGCKQNEAAKKAGYTGDDGTLRATAGRLLKDPNVIKAIKLRREKDKSKLNATRQEKLELLTSIMRDETVSYKHRLRAIETHCKMNGEFLQKFEHSMGEMTLKEGLKKVSDHLKSHPEEEKRVLEALEDEE
jgi:phage terminase small subunit